jgi:hypothetical protein
MWTVKPTLFHYCFAFPTDLYIIPIQWGKNP